MASKLGVAALSSPRILTTPIRKPTTSVSSTSQISVSFKDASAHFMGIRRLALRRKIFLLTPYAATDKQGQVEAEEEVVDSNVLQYCSLDKKGNKTKKSIGDLEQEFLQALQAFYYEGKAIMSNEEFDNLKEELMWEGSSVVMLSADEQRFLEASMAYVAGNPILSDAEFDELKLRLKIIDTRKTLAT